jgi:hypothetical protein
MVNRYHVSNSQTLTETTPPETTPQRQMTTLHTSVILGYTNGSSDKVYHIHLEEVGPNQYNVTGYNGRRGSTPALPQKSGFGGTFEANDISALKSILTTETCDYREQLHPVRRAFQDGCE